MARRRSLLPCHSLRGLPDLDEEADARKAAERKAEAAERKAAREEEGRKAAEEELVRLRAELERLSSSGD
jgi:hypothetical protein